MIILITEYNDVSFGGGSQMMRRQIRSSMKAVTLLAIIFMLAACEVKYTATFTPLVLIAPGTPSSFGTVGVAGTVSPFDATGTVEAILSLSPVPPTITPTAIISIEEGSEWSPTYERVDCGIIDDVVCFELCYGGDCFIYGNDDDRVERFVDMVEKREEKIEQLEILRKEQGGAIIDALGSCLDTGAKVGVATVAILGITAPEPLVSKILGGIAAGATTIVCGGKIYSAWQVEGHKQEVMIEEIYDASRDAIFEFQNLQLNPPE